MNLNEARAAVLKAMLDTAVIDQAEHARMSGSPGSEVLLAELNIDSMKVIDLCNALEDALGREIEVEELVENPSVDALARHFAQAAA